MYAVLVVVLSALVAPWAFWSVQWLGNAVSGAAWLARQPFRRVFDRCVLVVAVAGLWPLLRAIGFRSWAELGYVRYPDGWKHALVGFIYGDGSFLLAGFILIALGARTLRTSFDSVNVAWVQVQFLISAVVVALIEETLFRGGLQGVLQRNGHQTRAIVITSAVYSFVHFLKPQTAGIPASDVTWLSGFQYLGTVLAKSVTQPGMAEGFATLWLAGCVLGLAFARTKALYLSMGIHAGWVLTLKSYAFCTTAVLAPRQAWWVRSDLISSPVVWPILAVLFLGVNRLCHRKLRSLR